MPWYSSTLLRKRRETRRCSETCGSPPGVSLIGIICREYFNSTKFTNSDEKNWLVGLFPVRLRSQLYSRKYYLAVLIGVFTCLVA